MEAVLQQVEAIVRGEVPVGYKKSKYGVVPEDWELVKVKDVLKRVRKPVDVVKDEKYKQIGIRSHGKGIFYKEEVTGEELGNKSVFWIEPDCFIVNIVFAWELAVAKTTDNEVGYIASHRFPMYKPVEDKLDLDFVTYLFKSPRGKHLLNLASPGGAGRNKTLGQKEFEELEILIPKCIGEQRRIAKILSSWEKAIDLKQRLLIEKKAQKHGLMQKLLSGEIRVLGFNSEWEVKRIKEVSKLYRGASPRPISDPKWFDKTSKVGWVRISDVTKSSKYLAQTEQYLSSEGINKSRFVKKGSLVMSICATVGKPIITTFDVCIHDGFVVFEDLNIDKDYFYYALLRLEDQWKKYGQTGSQMNLNTEIVGNEKINFPKSEREQQTIVNLLSTNDTEIDLIGSELELLKKQSKGLMQQLLTGKIRVKV